MAFNAKGNNDEWEKNMKLFVIALMFLMSNAMANNVPEGADEDFRKEVGFPPVLQQWHFMVLSTGEKNTYFFSMYEGAESYVGTTVFDSLPKRFESIAGIKKVEQLDRELYEIVTINGKKFDIKKALWDEFVKAAADSFKISHTDKIKPHAPKAN